MPEQYVTPYIASNEQADALILEGSSLPPREKEELAATVKSMADVMVDTYGEYIPLSMYAKLDGIGHRVLVSDPLTFFSASYIWEEPDKFNFPRSYLGTEGRFSSQGNIIFSAESRNLWNRTDRNIKIRMAIRYGGIGRAIEQTSTGLFMSTIAHEVTHEFEGPIVNALAPEFDPDLSAVFCECGASYYQDKILEMLNMERFTFGATRDQWKVYNDLIQYYGSEVHKLFFGTTTNIELSNAILCDYQLEQIAKKYPVKV